MVRKLFLVIVLLASLGCQPAQDTSQKSLTFMAGYRPQANLPFVGVYVAQEQGFFAEEGLDVTIEHSSGGSEYLQLLATNQVHVTTLDAAVLLQRRADPGLPVVSLALIGQRGQQAFAALAESGFETPADWIGKTVGYKGAPPPDLFALLAANDISESEVELVNVGFDPRTLTEGIVDVYPVFKSNEPYLIRNLGYEVMLWEAAAYDVPTLGLTYATTTDIITEDPDRIARFTRAALRGIAYARQNPAEAIDIVQQYTDDQTDPDHMRFMLDTELADSISEVTMESGTGWQTEAQWQALHDVLLEYDALAQPLDVSDAFTTTFISTSDE